MNKRIKLEISILLIWSYLNTFLLIRNVLYHTVKNELGLRVVHYPFTDYNPNFDRELTSYIFYPFNSGEYVGSTIDFYDFTEYFVYVIGVWLIYFLYRFLKSDK